MYPRDLLLNFTTWSGVVAVSIALFAAGVLAGRRSISKARKKAEELKIPPKLEPGEYERLRQAYRRAYRERMRDYDRLIPWASGGALLLSMNFVNQIAPSPVEGRGWILAGWILLLVSIASTVLSHTEPRGAVLSVRSSVGRGSTWRGG